MNAAILTDLTKCIGCEACVLACKEANGLPREAPAPRLSHDALTVVETRGGVNVRRQCMHCLDPACVSVCPVSALRKTEMGPVTYDASRCLGCRYCMIACPFGVPAYEWHSPAPRVRKCTLCYDSRVKHGKQPACTEACPTGATIYGDRDALIAEAKRRIEAEPSRYVDRIYGLAEAGGTSVLYLSPVPFETLDFKNARTDPYPKLTWDVLSKLPNVVGIGGVMLFGVYWIIHRRNELANGHGEATASVERES
jgi:formate dehydrogenase iron-sulfur subunit